MSYASRVAPLPEYKAPDPEESRDEEGQLQREARRIKPGGPMRSIFAVQEEVIIPFPTLIPQEKKPQKVPMDLMDAIRQVKKTYDASTYKVLFCGNACHMFDPTIIFASLI